jgi:hypothetical protein
MITNQMTGRESFNAERRRVWSDAWIGTANANDCKKPQVATDWADAALAAFDSRFAKDFIV